MSQEKFAIRFGLGAIKAVGFGAMENAVKERAANGTFRDVYDFAERLDPRSINKKSIEALAKAGAFDSLHKNRCQIAESFDTLSSYSAQKKEAASSNQMSLFGGFPEENAKPELKKVSDWNKVGRLQKEFEAFGFFLNEHPVDDHISDLKKRGVIFSDKLERDELEDGNLVKMAGVVAGSKHRSGPRGRFAYLTISDPFGIFEAMIFDEAIITAARDILIDGSVIALECLIRKDDGGVRILVRDVKKLDDFIKNTKAQDKDFEDIKKQTMRSYNKNRDSNSGERPAFNSEKAAPKNTSPTPLIAEKKIFSAIEIEIKTLDPLQNIKDLLSKVFAPSDAPKNSRVFFAITQGERISRIELPQKYLLGEAEILKIKHAFGVVAVKVIP
jgi:DNA polymerase III alpha subunit